MHFTPEQMDILTGADGGKAGKAAAESAARGVSSETINRQRVEAGLPPLFKEPGVSTQKRKGKRTGFDEHSTYRVTNGKVW